MNRQEQDIRILQKINAHHRSAFAEKFPGQCEHILRLITERLHLGLTKTAETRVDDPRTWALQAQEIESLAHSIWLIQQVRSQL
jgi:hypothetical protein